MTRASNSLDTRVAELRRRAALSEFLSEWSLHLAAAIVLAAAAALCARALLTWERPRAAWCFAIVALTPATAYFRARRRFLSSAGAAAWLDVRAGSTGLILTELETGDPAWGERAARLLARAPDLPAAPWRRVLTRTAPCAAFALAALLIPVSSAGAGSFGTAAAILDRLDEKLATLEEQIRIDETPAAELRQRLEQLRSDLPGAPPEVQLEALDRFDESLREEAAKAAEAAESAMQQMSAAESAADAASQEKPADAQELLEKAVAELAQSGLEKGLEESLLREGFESDLTLPEGTRLDASKVQKVSKELREALAKKLAELQKSGLTKKDGAKGAGEKKKVDWSKFQEHECRPECKEGGS
jgi:hypothetical protein